MLPLRRQTGDAFQLMDEIGDPDPYAVLDLAVLKSYLWVAGLM